MVYNFKTVYETERYRIEVPQMVSLADSRSLYVYVTDDDKDLY